MRLKVRAYRWIAVDDAARMASRAGMSERAIRDYGENATELYVFEIESLDIPETPLTMQTLREEFGYIHSDAQLRATVRSWSPTTR